MRTMTLEGASETIGITYPDALVYINDLNLIHVTTTAETLSVRVVFGNPQTGGIVLSADTDNNYITVDISDALKRFDTYGALGVRIVVNGNYGSLSFNVCHGRTDALRYHGSGRKIIIPSVISRYELLLVANGTVTSMISYANQQQGVNNYPTPPTNTTVKVEYTGRTNIFGNVYAPEQTAIQYFDVEVVSCHGSDDAILRWIDHDGCYRYIVGKVRQRKIDADMVQYSVGSGPVRRVPGSVVASRQSVVTIGFHKVSPEVYLDEIMDTEELVMLNPNTMDTYPLLPDFSSIDVELMKSGDYELDFIAQL